MEGADPQTLRIRAEQGRHAGAHLAGRSVREGHGEDLLRGDAPLLDQVGDPRGEDARLAGARARQHEQRAARVSHGGVLRGVEREAHTGPGPRVPGPGEGADGNSNTNTVPGPSGAGW